MSAFKNPKVNKNKKINCVDSFLRWLKAVNSGFGKAFNL